MKLVKDFYFIQDELTPVRPINNETLSLNTWVAI